MSEEPREGTPQQGLAKASRIQAMPRGPRTSTPQRGLGKAIRFLREESGMTQKGLAERSGVSASWISRIEHGEVDPTWNTIARISEGLGIPMESVAKAEESFEEVVVR